MIDRFQTAIIRHLGLQFEDDKHGFLAEVLARRARANNLDTVAYVASLANPAATELAALAEQLTIGETFFFRNPDQFRALVETAIPARIAERGQLRILSAACASGEEPYSIAIAIHTAVPDPPWPLAIRAIDINPTALARARAGRYSSWSLRETPADVQRLWFRPEGRESLVDGRVRRAVRFEHENLVDDTAEMWRESYDVIFCRNVLMYFPRAVQQAVVARIERCLAPGGYLFLGHAETLRGLSQEFHLCHTHGTFYYERRREGAGARQLTWGDAPAAEPPPLAEPATDWVDDIALSASRIQSLIEREPPPLAIPEPELDRILDLVRHERFDDALAMLDALPSAPDGKDMLLLRSVVLTHCGRFAAAEEACQRLLALDELHAGAHYVMALCREGAGDRDGAIDHDQTAVYLDPHFAMPRLHLGLLARRADDRETARRELGQALSLLQREDASRLFLFGGGFRRDVLVALCRAELTKVGGAP